MLILLEKEITFIESYPKVYFVILKKITKPLHVRFKKYKSINPIISIFMCFLNFTKIE